MRASVLFLLFFTFVSIQAQPDTIEISDDKSVYLLFHNYEILSVDPGQDFIETQTGERETGHTKTTVIKVNSTKEFDIPATLSVYTPDSLFRFYLTYVPVPGRFQYTFTNHVLNIQSHKFEKAMALEQTANIFFKAYYATGILGSIAYDEKYYYFVVQLQNNFPKVFRLDEILCEIIPAKKSQGFPDATQQLTYYVNEEFHLEGYERKKFIVSVPRFILGSREYFSLKILDKTNPGDVLPVQFKIRPNDLKKAIKIEL